MTRFALSSLAALTLCVACGASESASTTPSETSSEATTEPSPAGTNDVDSTDLQVSEVCTTMFVRQRECQDVFLPELVALRVRLDVPQGIAARDAAEGRDKLLEYAREEYAADSTDESIAATCSKIAEQVSEDEIAAMKPKADECLAQTACEPFVACTLELQEARMTR